MHWNMERSPPTPEVSKIAENRTVLDVHRLLSTMSRPFDRLTQTGSIPSSNRIDIRSSTDVAPALVDVRSDYLLSTSATHPASITFVPVGSE
jgi:hypothetical protein